MKEDFWSLTLTLTLIGGQDERGFLEPNPNPNPNWRSGRKRISGVLPLQTLEEQRQGVIWPPPLGRIPTTTLMEHHPLNL